MACEPLDAAGLAQRVSKARHDGFPVFDLATSRHIESQALSTHPPGTLMRRAGRAVARLALATAAGARRFWVAAGPGGNGGDGLHAAAELAACGCQVEVCLLADATGLAADAAEGLARARSAGVRITTQLPDDLSAHELLIDALLGIGSSRPLDGAFAEAVRRMADARVPCLAVDVPSGLSAQTGALFGPIAVRATHTLSLLNLRPGLLTAAGRAYAGEIWLDTLGTAPPPGTEPCAWLEAGGSWHGLARHRPHDSHKGSYGDVLVIGGAPGMAGAARLAAHAALAAGAGRTFVSLLDPAAPAADPTRPEWLWRPLAWTDAALLGQATVVIGCGGALAVDAALPEVLLRAPRVVLDADALNALSRDAGLRELTSCRRSKGLATVLTPHPLEAARLLACSAAEVQANRLGAAQHLSESLGAVVVLKGSGSVTAAPGQRPVINGSGSAALASGGTGDVLAGWIAGQWSALHGGMPAGQEALSQAARIARAVVWLHGEAGAASGRGGAVRALDLVEAMGQHSGCGAPTMP